jgi:enoyl-CoA hydratase/3-hydroxyacyl-CoA dehydrogenase
MSFDARAVVSRTSRGIATLSIHRPDTQNALDAEVLSCLADAFHAAASDSFVDGIVIAGVGPAFCSGVDLRFFLRQLEAEDLEPILDFTRAAHALFDSIDDCATPVVALVHGLAFGGGLELALACDRIVATPDARLAFPQTGLGIYPALGGTQRAPRRLGVGMATALVFTAREVAGSEARAIGLVDVVADPGEIDEAVHSLLEGDLGSPEPVMLRGAASTVARFFEHHSVEDIRTGRVSTGGSELLEGVVTAVRSKPPVALRIAERLIDDGFDRPLHEGLHLELEHLVEVFGSPDALAGLAASDRGPDSRR